MKSPVDVVVKMIAAPPPVDAVLSGSRTVVQGERSLVVLDREEAVCAAWWLGMGEVRFVDELPSDWVVVG